MPLGIRLACGRFPFGLGGQARAGPAGIGIGLVIRQMHHRLARHQRPAARKREFLPASLLLAPVQRVGDLLAAAPVPALGQPVRGVGITTIGHEGQVLGIRHRPRCQRIGLQKDAVARQFVVEGKARACMACLHQAALERLPVAGRSRLAVCHRRGISVGGPQRVAPQQMLDVGQQQLLVLLLVLQPQLQQTPDGLRQAILLQQAEHARINIGAVGQHGGQRRPRQQAALRPRMLAPHALVVGVEEHAKRRVERAKALLVPLQDEGLEKPAGMRQVPFGGTGVRHGLHAAVLGRQRPRQRLGGGAHGQVAAHRIVVARLRCGGVGALVHGGAHPHARAYTMANQPRSSVQCWVLAKPAWRSSAVKAGSACL